MATTTTDDDGASGLGWLVGVLVVSTALLLGGLYVDVIQPGSRGEALERLPGVTGGADVADFADTYAEVSDGVVRIEMQRCEGQDGATGTGALIGPDLVLTAAHVVSSHATIQLLLGGQSASGEVVGFAPEVDLAVVRASQPLHGHVFRLSDSAAPIGSSVAAIGYPRSGALSMAGPGIVSAYGDAIQFAEWDDSVVSMEEMMRTTVPINGGNSGGPLVDSGGEVVGLISASLRASGSVQADGAVEVEMAEGFNYAVPVGTVDAWTTHWAEAPEAVPPQACDLPAAPAPVDLVTAQTEGPDTEVVQAILFDYFDGINTGDYERAYRQRSADARASLSLEQFTQDQLSSVISGVVILTAARGGDDLLARVTFRSTQAPENGPEGYPCVFWLLDYRFVPGGEHGWTIASSSETPEHPRYEPCA